MQFKRIYPVAILLCALMLALMVAGCGSGKEPAGSQEPAAQPLVINLEGGDWGYPTPFTHYQRGPGIFKANLIFDSLLERGKNGYIPWLAQKWDISSDGLVYTFTLQDGVKWQDGQPLTADDVVFSYNYYLQHPPVSGSVNFSGDTGIEKMEAADAKTVRLTATGPDATLLGKVGAMRILPKHIWESVDDPNKFTGEEAVIGSGPYKLTEYNKEQGAYMFKAYEDFWGPKQAVDEIRFIPVSDSILAFDNGEIDFTSVTPDILGKYENNSEFKISQNPAFWGYVLCLNLEKRAELQQQSVRQAIGYAMDQAELIEKVARGAAVPASAGYLPVNHIWYNKDVKKYNHDVEKAKSLLGGQTLSFKLLTGNSQPEVRVAELLKMQLAQAGITLEVQSVDMKTRDAAIKGKDYELALNGYGGWGADADMIRTRYAAQQAESKSPSADIIPGYHNDQVTELCQKQLTELDEQKRKAIVFELQKLIAEDLPQIPIYNTTDYVVYRPAKYDGWKYMFDHHELTHSKISFLEMK